MEKIYKWDIVYLKKDLTNKYIVESINVNSGKISLEHCKELFSKEDLLTENEYSKKKIEERKLFNLKNDIKKFSKNAVIEFVKQTTGNTPKESKVFSLSKDYSFWVLFEILNKRAVGVSKYYISVLQNWKSIWETTESSDNLNELLTTFSKKIKHSRLYNEGFLTVK